MLVGYARTSTVEQDAGLEAQIRDLKALGCEEIFSEQVSSVATERPELERAIQFIRKGDTLVVTKLDRLARSIRNMLELRERISAKGAELRIVNMNFDTKTPTGKLMLNMLGSIAEFEREMMLERQKEGIAKAKAEGKFKGRAPTARAKADLILEMREKGIGAGEIAHRLEIGRASVYRVLNAQPRDKMLTEVAEMITD